MPFLGGETLATVFQDLAAPRRVNGRPRSGRDLLVALDRVAAPEYRAAVEEQERARPARQQIASRSYAQALAWIIARLAEALDHAYSRGVLHGDIKPSNILLTSDGLPMLLDFNLAVGWRCSERDLPDDSGGTLAYMAPERLRAVCSDPTPADPENGLAARPTAADRHRADLFALGIVLLEGLTGRAPETPRGSPREQASALLRLRRHGGEALARAYRTSIPPGLRPILSRCLAPDPADRYRRSGELAEDLDRWAGNRRLAFVREPRGWYRLGRWARQRRTPLAAAALTLAVAIISTLAAWQASQATLREQAQAKLAALWDGAGSRVFRYHEFGHWRRRDGDISQVAPRHLAYYGVLAIPDWRRSADFQALPPGEQRDLEAWVLEQGLRMGRELRRRPDAPDDWRRGLEVIERLVELPAVDSPCSRAAAPAPPSGTGRADRSRAAFSP